MSRLEHHILIVGTGSIGERHLRCFQATQRANVSFVEPRDDVAATIEKRYPQAKRHASLSEGLAAGVTAAVIATPASLHLRQATETISNNVSVLIEKPLSVHFDGLDELQKSLKSSDAVAAVAYVYRANPVLADMREAVISGRFGRPLQLIACCGQNFPTYRPGYAQTYYAQRESGGGAVQDALTHIINAGEWLLGPIDRLVADIDHQQLPDVEVEDMAHVLARHGDVPASYSLNQYQPANEVSLTLICEKALVRFEGHQARWRVMWEPDGTWDDHSFPPVDRDVPFLRQANAFLDLLEKKSAPLCSLEEGVATLRVNRAILRSVDEGTWQLLNQPEVKS